MIEKRTTSRPAGESDPEVSGIYREVATERAPASLNESVLRQAGRAGDGYARSLTWLRPMAWAATVGLCLAIVLELTAVPDAEPLLPAVMPGQPAAGDAQPAAGAAGPEARPRPAVGAADTRASSPANVDRPAPGAAGVPGSAARPAPLAGGAAGRRETTARDVAAFRITDAPALEAAAAAARLRDEADEVGVETSSPGSAGVCGAEAEASPETWLDCIGELRESGRGDEADAEQERLRAAFPDFDLPCRSPGRAHLPLPPCE